MFIQIKVYPTGKVISLTDYLHIPNGMDPTLMLAKVIQIFHYIYFIIIFCNKCTSFAQLTEATTDALFNLPALLTTQAWAKIAPSFLYCFEHIGQTVGRGSHFLSGLPIVSSQLGDTEHNVHAAHGDDLAFLFDTHDLFGQSVQGAEVRFSA